MSQIESTDLLCKARRQELSADEQRRLDELVQSSLEARLMSHMLTELDSESRVRPGDDVLLARITARALGAPEKKAPARGRRVTVVLLAAAALLAASLAGAWFSGVRPLRSSEPAAPVTATATARPKAAKPRLPRALPSPPPEPPIAPAEVPTTPAPPAVSAGSSRETRAKTASSASELFARANELRRAGRGAEAAALNQLLLELYPSSREAGPTRLALAKYLQARDPARALAQYRALAGSADALRAEALWGISETATTLGERSVAARALADLVREFPDSAYAEVARARTSHGSP